MIHRFHCPECNHEHDEPAEATFVLGVRCVDCELVALLAAHVETRARESEAVPTAA